MAVDQVVVREVRPAELEPDALSRLVAGLSEVTIDCVAGGASVGFMAPFGNERAATFWTTVLDGVRRDERMLFIAEDVASGAMVGTVQVIVAVPENQPHRGEIAKMLVHRGARRRGIGEALLHVAEQAALARGKTLLVLDTASDDAERLYQRRGWQQAGVIPGYALWPDGGLVDTVLYFKWLVPMPDGDGSTPGRQAS